MAAESPVFRRTTTRHTPEGAVVTEDEIPVASCWSLPLTATELSRQLGIGRSALSDAIAGGDLPVRRLGSLLRVRADHLPPVELARLFEDG